MIIDWKRKAVGRVGVLGVASTITVFAASTPIAEEIHVTQVPIEILHRPASDARVTQVAIEYGWIAPGQARVTQICIEIIKRARAAPPTLLCEFPMDLDSNGGTGCSDDLDPGDDSGGGTGEP